jgi:hypothetical protein
MSEFLSRATEQWLYWRLLIIKILLYSLTSAASVWMVATANVNIGSLDFWARVTLIVGMIGNWGGTMMALVDQTMSRLAKGQMPVGDTNPPFPPSPAQPKP